MQVCRKQPHCGNPRRRLSITSSVVEPSQSRYIQDSYSNGFRVDVREGKNLLLGRGYALMLVNTVCARHVASTSTYSTWYLKDLGDLDADQHSPRYPKK